MKAKDGHEQAMACAAPNPDLRRLERPRASARQYYFVDPYDLIRFVKLVKRMASTSTPTSAPTCGMELGYSVRRCIAVLLLCHSAKVFDGLPVLESQ
jgi:hypothetical protein